MPVPPLDGVRVVETATFMSGPWATAMLGDLGAEVVRVEPPGGDPFRRFGRPTETPYSPVWASCNRGKRAVVADLKTTDGVATLLDLVDGADVFLSNWRPAVADRLGVGDAALAARNPRLIRVWLSGVGAAGPHADEPAFDTVIQARAGMTDAVSRSDGFELFALDQADMVRAIVERFSVVTSSQPVAHWLAGFGARDIPVARCLTMDEHLADPQVRHNDLYRVEQWPGVGGVRTVRYPATSPAWGGALWPRRPAPPLPESS